MIILDMIKKSEIRIDNKMFNLENDILTLELDPQEYDLTGKTITAKFSATGIETLPLTVTAEGIIQLPIYSNLIKYGLNYIQLNFRWDVDKLEQSGKMMWRIDSSIETTAIAQEDIDIISYLINEINLAVDEADRVVDETGDIKLALDESTSSANLIKGTLDASILNANTINNTLSDVALGTIKQATDINLTLDGNIDDAELLQADIEQAIIDNQIVTKPEFELHKINYTTLNTRVDTIITTPVPVGEILAQELIDARQGELSLGANLTGVKEKLNNFGAMPLDDSLLDSSTIIQYLLDNNEQLFLPYGIFNVSNLNTGICKKIWGHGTLKSINDGVVLTINSDEVAIDGITFEGSDNAIYTLEKAINIDTKYNTRITNCRFKNFKGESAISILNTSIGYKNTLIENCSFLNNKKGIHTYSLGEFAIISSCDFKSNTVGIVIASGNVTVNACNINSNVDGIQVISGPNDSHGIISNNNINHNTNYAILLQNIENGMTIIGNHIYQGAIAVLTATNQPIRFMNNVLDPANLLFDNSTLVIFKDNHFPNDYLISESYIDTSWNSTNPTTIITEGNTWKNDIFNTKKYNMSGGYVNITRTANQSLVPGQNVVTGNPINSTAFNPIDTHNLFYVDGKIYKKGLSKEAVKVNFSVCVNKLSTDKTDGWYPSIRLNGVTHLLYLPMFYYSSTSIYVTGSATVVMNTGDYLEVVIGVPSAVTASINKVEFMYNVNDL